MGKGEEDKRRLDLGRFYKKRPPGSSDIRHLRAAVPARPEGAESPDWQACPSAARAAALTSGRAGAAGKEGLAGRSRTRLGLGLGAPAPGDAHGAFPICCPLGGRSCFPCGGDGGGEEARPSVPPWGRGPRGWILSSRSRGFAGASCHGNAAPGVDPRAGAARAGAADGARRCGRRSSHPLPTLDLHHLRVCLHGLWACPPASAPELLTEEGFAVAKGIPVGAAPHKGRMGYILRVPCLRLPSPNVATSGTALYLAHLSRSEAGQHRHQCVMRKTPCFLPGGSTGLKYDYGL